MQIRKLLTGFLALLAYPFAMLVLVLAVMTPLVLIYRLEAWLQGRWIKSSCDLIIDLATQLVVAPNRCPVFETDWSVLNGVLTWAVWRLDVNVLILLLLALSVASALLVIDLGLRLEKRTRY